MGRPTFALAHPDFYEPSISSMVNAAPATADQGVESIALLLDLHHAARDVLVGAAQEVPLAVTVTEKFLCPSRVHHAV